MVRGTFVIRDGKCVPKHEAPPLSDDRRSHLACPMVIGDAMPMTAHVDGNSYDSKSRFRAVTRAHGLTEMGNDPQRIRPYPRQKPDRKAIKDSVEKATARFNRGERAA